MKSKECFLHIKRSEGLKGEVRMPRSKTNSFKALILASLAKGESYIREAKISADWHEAVKAMRLYGARIEEVEPNVYKIMGVDGKPKTPADIINVNNSGTMLPYVCGIAALCPGWSVITGDESIRTLRKVSKNYFEPFGELGVQIISTKDDGMAPLVIKGRVTGGVAHMDGIAVQAVYCVFVAVVFSEKPVEIYVRNAGEKGYLDSLLYWFRRVGLQYENVGGSYEHFRFPGNKVPKGFDVTIPFEWSAPSYPLLAGVLCPDSEIVVRGMSDEDPYGDKQVIGVLQRMGADIRYEGEVLTARTSELHGVEVDMNDMTDQVPTVAIAACFAKGKTVIKNAFPARWKECDRIAAICTELKKMGAKVEEREDGLVIDQDGSWRLKAGEVNGYLDHRMVMAFAVAGMQLEGETVISGAQMVEKSFETFVPDMVKAGARLRVIEGV